MQNIQSKKFPYYSDETPLNSKLNAARRGYNEIYDNEGDDNIMIQIRNDQNQVDLIPYRIKDNNLYLHSIEIFQTINLIREKPLFLVEKIDDFLKNYEKIILELNSKENERPYKISMNILLDIKQFLLIKSSVDCIMSEEALYHVVLSNSDLLVRNISDSSMQAIIKKISKEYSNIGLNFIEFIVFNYNNLESIYLIMLLMENEDNREKLFKENYQFGTVVCSFNKEGIPFTLILFVNDN